MNAEGTITLTLAMLVIVGVLTTDEATKLVELANTRLAGTRLDETLDKYIELLS